jgi:hypothetical protein
MIEIDLTPYGAGVFQCKGTLQTKRLIGHRLLLLFGERHSLKPFIRDTLLNVVRLDKLGVLSCVGVEGHPSSDFPGYEAEQAFRELHKEHDGNEEKLIGDMLRAIKGPNFYFWKTLILMRPNLKIESVDDLGLYNKAVDLKRTWCNQRYDHIYQFLDDSDLFEVSSPESTRAAKVEQIKAKVNLQFEQEWAEHEYNVGRDDKMIKNLLTLWDRSGPNKIAVLNAGSSHQWRIARLLPPDVKYYHIEQP